MDGAVEHRPCTGLEADIFDGGRPGPGVAGPRARSPGSNAFALVTPSSFGRSRPVNRLGRGCAFVLAASLTASCASSARPNPAGVPDGFHGAPLLWRARKPDRPGTVYVLGSVHLRKSGDERLDRAVGAALDESDTVILEADVSDTARLSALTIELGMLPRTERLRDHLAPETHALLRARVEAHGVAMTIFERMRPWLAAVSLMSFEMSEAGLSPERGVDTVIRRAAHRRGLDVRFLETAEAQLRLFADLNADLQEALLLDVLEEPTPAGESVDALIDLYRQGDLEALERELIGPYEDAPELERRLLTDRNRRWVGDIEPLFDRDRVFFVVVGASHVLGEQSLLALLRRSGATVRRLPRRGLEGPEPEARGAARLEAWRTVGGPELGFSLEMPGEPITQPVPPMLQLEEGRRLVLDREVYAFSVTVLRFVESASETLRAESPAILSTTFREIAREVGGELGASRSLDAPRGHAREQIIELPNGRLWVRGYIVGTRVFELRAVLMNEALEDPELRSAKDRFFGGFRIHGNGDIVLHAPR